MWVLDESSYRIDKTNFASREEAEQKAGESARILGRPISVYQLIDRELIFDFKVLPDGSVEQGSETHDPETKETVTPQTTPILGSVVETLDEISEVLEQAGRTDLALAIDAEVHKISAEKKIGTEALAEKLIQGNRNSNKGNSTAGK